MFFLEFLEDADGLLALDEFGFAALFLLLELNLLLLDMLDLSEEDHLVALAVEEGMDADGTVEGGVTLSIDVLKFGLELLGSFVEDLQCAMDFLDIFGGGITFAFAEFEDGC